MMARLGALMKRGWMGMSGAGPESFPSGRDGIGPDGLEAQDRVLTDLLPVTSAFLGETCKPVDPQLWPTEACRTVRELKARVAELEEDNIVLRERCAVLERCACPETSAAARDLLDDARGIVDDAKVFKCEFLRMVHFDLLSPLSSIYLMLQLVEETDLSAEHQRYVQLGLSACKTLEQNLRAILACADLHGSCLQLKRKPLTIKNVLGGIEMKYGELCRQKGLGLVLCSDPCLPEQLVGDEDRMRQMLEHLMDNALRFTQTGEIRVEAHALSRIGDNRVRIRLSVRDTGVGIPEKYLQSVQEPFTQVPAGLCRTAGGLGLGLAMARKLAGLMDGHLRLESMEGLYTAVHCFITLETQPDVCES